MGLLHDAGLDQVYEQDIWGLNSLLVAMGQRGMPVDAVKRFEAAQTLEEQRATALARLQGQRWIVADDVGRPRGASPASVGVGVERCYHEANGQIVHDGRGRRTGCLTHVCDRDYECEGLPRDGRIGVYALFDRKVAPALLSIAEVDVRNGRWNCH